MKNFNNFKQKYFTIVFQQEKHGFLLTYDNDSKSIYLLASTKSNRDLWVKILDHHINLCKRQKFDSVNKTKYINSKYESYSQSQFLPGIGGNHNLKIQKF